MSGYFSIMGGLGWLANPIKANVPDLPTMVEVTGGRGELVWITQKYKNEIINDKDENLIRLHEIVVRLTDTTIKELGEKYDFILDEQVYKGMKGADVATLGDSDFLYTYLYLFAGGKHGDEIFKDVFMPTLQGKSFRRTLLVLRQTSQRFTDVVFENLDAVEVLKKYDNPNTFFFIDPPYPSRERYYRIHDLDWAELRRTLTQLAGSWMLISDISLSPRVGTSIRNKERLRYIIDSHNDLIQLLSQYPHRIFVEPFRMGFSNLDFKERLKTYAMITNYPLARGPIQIPLGVEEDVKS